MADTVEFSITGLDSLLGKLDSVTDDVKLKGGRAALRKAAMIVVQAAKQGAEKSTIQEPAGAFPTYRVALERPSLQTHGRLRLQNWSSAWRRSSEEK